jgi:hypothetical protein
VRVTSGHTPLPLFLFINRHIIWEESMFAFNAASAARRFAGLLACALAAVLTAPWAAAAPQPSPLSLFGTPLKGASRASLRQALTQAGLVPTRVDDAYYCDLYSTNGVPEGSTELQVCYTEDDNTFASARYTFPAFMDTGLVKRVVETVSVKYGRPSALVGNYGLGEVSARWAQPQGMEVRVNRGWPDTTTYLQLLDRNNEGKMKAQMKAAEDARLRQRAQQDTRAF